MTPKQLTLRSARPEDCHFVWTTNNHPSVRAQSIQSDSIPWDDHVQWFKKSLERDDRVLLIAEASSKPIGTLRFDLDTQANVATISIALSESSRGKGYSHRLIDQGAQEMLDTHKLTSIIALIRPDNLASLRAFSRAGFLESGQTVLNDVDLLRYERLNLQVQ